MAGTTKRKPPRHESQRVSAREKQRNQGAFLAALRESGNITRSAAAVGIDRGQHYDWLETDPTYPERAEEAFAAAADRLEEEARRRACDGLVRYKFRKDGEPLRHPETGEPYFELEYSDPLLICLLKAAKPTKYRDRKEVSGPGGGPVEFTLDIAGGDDGADTE